VLLEPSADPLQATLSSTPSPDGSAELRLDVQNQTTLGVAVVTSVELQDGMSEPVLPAVLDDAPWEIESGGVGESRIVVRDLPPGSYKIEAVVSSVDDEGALRNTLAETYLVVDDQGTREVRFEEWLPRVNVSDPVLDPMDPDPEASEGGAP
jgi:hypothetical protein